MRDTDDGRAEAEIRRLLKESIAEAEWLRAERDRLRAEAKRRKSQQDAYDDDCFPWVEVEEDVVKTLQNRLEGINRFLNGDKYRVSTGIDAGTTYGYGKLDDFGFWEYPIPEKLIDWRCEKSKLEEELEKVKAELDEWRNEAEWYKAVCVQRGLPTRLELKDRLQETSKFTGDDVDMSWYQHIKLQKDLDRANARIMALEVERDHYKSDAIIHLKTLANVNREYHVLASRVRESEDQSGDVASLAQAKIRIQELEKRLHSQQRGINFHDLTPLYDEHQKKEAQLNDKDREGKS